MPRKKSIMTMIAQAARETERANNRYIKAQEKAAREAERTHQKALREQQKAKIQTEKEQKQKYLESRIIEVENSNLKLASDIASLENILSVTLEVDDYIDLNSLKKTFQPTEFHPSITLQVKLKEPQEPEYPELSFVQSLIPGAKSRHEQEIKDIDTEHEKKLAKYNEMENDRKKRIDKLNQIHQSSEVKQKFEAKEHNETIDSWIASIDAGEPDAIIDYFALVLESSVYPGDFPQHTKLAYVPESKQLVLEYDLPSIEAIPNVKQYKYVKSRDEITSTSLPKTQVKKLYNSVIAQVTVRTLHEILEADRKGNVETIVFNGHVDTINPATGQPERPCLVTVRTTKDVFEVLNLALVDPIACLKGLNASVSSKPEELAPVRPVVEFNMVDARFVEETDMISELDVRQNLMDLSPYEFENLITNLFQKMGLETKQTQSSRDGGVDCIAFDNRPIFGGKVVIQAKRYKNTVGVSAVRDLFGTMQNEGASKGILVTTSGYGKSSFEFADGKPIELLDGSNLLYLLAEHAELEAKIVMPVE